jgi:hypothetical protein
MSLNHSHHRFGCVFLVTFAWIIAVASTAGWTQTLDFNRDIRPLLSDNCFYCHGPDEQHREADLRLDQEDAAKALAIKPGDASESELFLRLTSADPDQKMPPPESGKELTSEQIEKIQIWIENGAPWEAHWSFQPPQRPDLPSVSDPSWTKNAIDHFILAQLDRKNWRPSPAAPPSTLVRRLALDLTGLPPTFEQVQRYANEPTETVYEALVDELLASPQYGERMAMVWLDAARYADTDGFQIDETRTNWPWRDWVVEAYNANKRFDEFTLEQFAGDLLPDATDNQQLATTFHRNHMTNGEGGRDPEESRVDYVIDRVNTMGTAWLGLTLGCCQCHSHKYDPLSQREYYALADFFNNIEEDGRAGKGAGPHLKINSPYVESGLKASEAWLESQRNELGRQESLALKNFETWLFAQHQRLRQKGDHRSWMPPQLIQARTSTDSDLQFLPDGQFQVTGPNPRHDDYTLVIRPTKPQVTGMRLEVYPESEQGRLTLAENGHLILTNLKVYRVDSDGRTMLPIEIRSAHADHQGAASGRVYGPVATVLDDDPRTGWTSTGREPTEARTAVFQFAETVALQEGQNLLVELRHRSLQGYASMRRFRVLFTDESGPVLRSTDSGPFEKLARVKELTSLEEDLRNQLEQQFLDEQVTISRLRDDVARAQKRVNTYKQAANPVSVMVLRDRKERRTSHILVRGVWDNKGEAVQADFPSALGIPMPESNADNPTRLELARWLMHPDHPLTARVAVNRYWQTLFGRGLVASSEDFGAQGDPPTHPQLLDWLAVEFQESGWDIKQIQKLMVMSQTYRQSSDWTPLLMERDPDNEWLARASRFRLPSWMIRDVVLATGELLSLRLGGPPVFPTQPPGAWADSTMGRFHYEESVGDDLFRRSIYAFWRRSVAPTAFFDTSKRRTCQIRNVRTNTPLHALTLLNDKSVLASAFNLAKKVLAAPENDTSRMAQLVQQILSRSPSPHESEILLEELHRLREYYDAETSEAEKLVQQYAEVTAAYAAQPKVESGELAAWTLVASTLLNLDEAQTRE